MIGATVGDLCEIGNASKLMPGARLGDRVFLGEGTLVPAGMTLPSDVVAVGRPARIIRTASADDLARLLALRDGDLSVPPPTAITVEDTQETITMGQLYEYRGIVPSIAASAALFPTAEITGDVVVGERTIIGAGVKIIGDSHGPVRIGNDVQILENTVLHLLPDNDLIIDDGVIIGPGGDDPRLSHRHPHRHRTRRHRLRRQRARRRLRRASRRGRQATLPLRRRHRHRRLPRRRHRTPPRSSPATPAWALQHDDLPAPTPTGGPTQ